MKIIVSIIATFFLINLQAQTFEELITSGSNYFSKKQFIESATSYEQAFKINEGNAIHYYDAACAWALAGDTINSLKYLQISADKGWHNVKHIQQDEDLSSLHSVIGWKEVLSKVQLNLNEYERNFNLPLKKQLENIYVKDQTLRQLYLNAEDKFGRESEEMNYFWQLIEMQDSLNELEVVEIINQYGWVGTNTVGGQGNATLWLVIQHAPIEIQQKYLPLLKESVLRGESNGSHLAMLEDRIHMYLKEPQIYGSQVVRDEKNGQQVVYEIYEPEYVNQRRSELGLGPIEEYLKRMGVEWKIEQKNK